MLDTDTKRRIDTARDILVGKVPDPKSQVEQITIALIYKFMDDMDAESEELGGERTFFQGTFEKYAWRTIFDPRLGGHELLILYSEAIMKMNENPGIPQLFRDIFKNAYLPYRDPETLKSFLKIINEFDYDHSERLGDAFEYLLSVLSSQGDAGQFRTPRHIIDFMVDIMDPKKSDSILDPACGTAGFLISSYKHIIKLNSENYKPEEDKKAFEAENITLNELTINNTKFKGEKLTPDERNQLAQNIWGYDISPDMVRLSLVNMYLHGLHEPHIQEYDTLTSEDNWNEYADVILANPPFMSPKGGIRPHKRFSILSNRSEVLFVDYMAEHLTTHGRAAIIVPEGIIFQSGKAYKSLRKMLVNEYLVGVISLPAGLFNPYSGVKTSIIWLDKSLSKKTDKIFFLKVENDGFDLGAQRRPIKKNDLPNAAKVIRSYKEALRNDSEFDMQAFQQMLVVEKSRIAENGEYNLSGERYNKQIILNPDFPLVKFGDICTNLDGKRVPITQSDRKTGKYPYYGASGIVDYVDDFIFDEDLLLVSEDGANLLARVTPIAFSVKGKIWVNNHAHVLKFDSFYTQKYVEFILNSKSIEQYITGSAQPKLNQNALNSIEIPLPPLSIQEEIVAEIESYQKIIDAARQVVENYIPRIEINPEWEMVELGKVCKIKGGYAFKSSDYCENGIQLIRMGNVKRMFFDSKNAPSFLPVSFKSKYSDFVIKKGDLLISMTGTVGKEDYGNVCRIDIEGDFLLNQRVGKLEINKHKLEPSFIYYFTNSEQFRKSLFRNSSGGVRQSNISNKGIESILISLPPLDTQGQIVTQIERERMLVNANKQLIEVFEQKIKERIVKVWGS